MAFNDFTKGCTGVSWVARLIGVELPEEGCCDEHDLFYEQGGSLRTKLFADWLLTKCVYRKNGQTVWATAKAALGFTVVSCNPYAIITWIRASR